MPVEVVPNILVFSGPSKFPVVISRAETPNYSTYEDANVAAHDAKTLHTLQTSSRAKHVTSYIETCHRINIGSQQVNWTWTARLCSGNESPRYSIEVDADEYRHRRLAHHSNRNEALFRSIAYPSNTPILWGPGDAKTLWSSCLAKNTDDELLSNEAAKRSSSLHLTTIPNNIEEHGCHGQRKALLGLHCAETRRQTPKSSPTRQ
jgi:hypothetical protein